MTFTDELILHFGIGFTSTAIMLIAGFFLLRSYAKIKMKASLFLAFSTIAGGVWAFGSTIYPAMPTSSFASTIYIIAVIASYVMFSLIFVFVEYVKGDKIGSFRMYINGALFGAITFLLIARIGAPIGFDMPLRADFGFYAAAQVPFLILQLVFFLHVGIEFTKMGLEMLRYADTKKRKRQTVILLIGSTIAFYGSLAALIMVEIIFIPSIVLLVAAIGVSLLAISFGMDPKVAYFLPYDVSILVVLDESGKPLFTYRFSGIEMDEILFSGAISAITSLMKESLKTKESIKLVEMESRRLVLDLRERVSAFVITNRSGQVLQAGLSAFMDAFQEEFKTQLEKEEICDISEFYGSKMLVQQYLGFLQGSSSNNIS